ncbi:MAG: OsmC family protein [Deltaproteobacteria bacterium]|nr:OsmC family protein [Deltaproteobacteria bacterium]MBW2361330.1 OsmC family protein [Deltaproteobacteria bacterium]
MSEHRSTIEWQRGDAAFDYESYSRNHTWRFENGLGVEASAAPEFLGDAARIDPEEALVASIASCHMLTFLALAARKRWVVERYRDAAVGTLEKNSDGKLAVTRVVLHPEVEFADVAPSTEQLEKAHHKAHEGCFIANSVRTQIDLEPV